MKGQCPNCKGLFDAQPEWIGQQAQCPHCQAMITVQALQAPLKAQQNKDKSAFYACFLIIIGAIQILLAFAIELCYRVVGRFYESTFDAILSQTYIFLPVIGCIISVLYFMENTVQKKKIQWEYLGIVISFNSVVYSLWRILLFSFD